MGRDYRQTSRGKLVSNNEDLLTIEEIKFGAILRIADATELMAQDRLKMERDISFYKNEMNVARDRWNDAERSNAALRGHITRLRNKIKSLTNEEK
jgi:hypothetical protein